MPGSQLLLPGWLTHSKNSHFCGGESVWRLPWPPSTEPCCGLPPPLNQAQPRPQAGSLLARSQSVSQPPLLPGSTLSQAARQAGPTTTWQPRQAASASPHPPPDPDALTISLLPAFSCSRCATTERISSGVVSHMRSSTSIRPA